MNFARNFFAFLIAFNMTVFMVGCGDTDVELEPEDDPIADEDPTMDDGSDDAMDE